MVHYDRAVREVAHPECVRSIAGPQTTHLLFLEAQPFTSSSLDAQVAIECGTGQPAAILTFENAVDDMVATMRAFALQLNGPLNFLAVVALCLASIAATLGVKPSMPLSRRC